MAPHLRFAERLASEEEWQARWSSAVEAIAAETGYGGLRLTRQVGLVPLGPDPDSDLWEFWHVQSGVEPWRGTDGRLVLTEDMQRYEARNPILIQDWFADLEE